MTPRSSPLVVPAADLILYHTLGCHLCELAEALVVPLAQARGLRLKRVDIADSEQLLERYGTRIPVLRAGALRGEEEIGWPFDAERVRDLLTRLDPASAGASRPASC